MAFVFGRVRSGTRDRHGEERTWEQGRSAGRASENTSHRNDYDRNEVAGNDWDDGYDDTDHGREKDDIDRMQLPQKRRRQYMTFFTVLTMVIAAASCILVVLLMKGQSASDAANDARNQALEDKLSAIESSLGALDQSVVVTGDTAAASTTQQYEELGATVDSLRTNLTDYRDNNDIQNEEIGDHLDRVIAQLDRIKEDMTAQQAQEDQADDEIGSRLDSLNETSRTGTSNLADELEAVHKDIASLIDAAGDDQTGNYKELKGILTATDASLSDLVADKFDETGTLISSGMSRLQGSIAGVSGDVSSGLENVNSSVSSGLQSVGDDIAGVNTNIADLGTSLGGVNESLSVMSGTIGGIDARVDTVQGTIDDLQDILDDLADQNAEADDTILEHVDTVKTDLTTFRKDVQDRVQAVADQLTALQEAIDRNAEAGEGGLGEETLAALTENVQLLQDALGNTQESVDTVDGKIDWILKAMGLVDPETDPSPEPEPEPDPTQAEGTT